MKTTGKITSKLYECKTCGYQEKHETNHYGEFYNTLCKECKNYSTWKCLDPMPRGYTEPPRWQTVMLSDLLAPKK